MNLEKEREAIQRTLQYFFDGLDNQDFATIMKAFHPDAMSWCVTKNGLSGGPVSSWEKGIEKSKTDPAHLFNEKSRKNIAFIDITDDAASVKVEWNFTPLMFTDYYNLLKLDGQWLIMNKIFHTTFFEK